MTEAAQPAVLQALCRLGWRHLGAAEAFAQRDGTREVLLKPRLVEFLQARRFDYKGAPHPLSPSAIEQILRELSTLGLGDGLLAANERLYARLLFGITVTEFMADGRRHQPTIALIDWTDIGANRFDLTDDLHVLSSGGTHHRAVDLVGYVNGIPLALLDTDRAVDTDDAHAVQAGIGRHLRNQREDEIAHLYVYAQLLLSLGSTDGRYATTRTPARFWARWRSEDGAALAKSDPRDDLLAGVMAPARLLELVRGYLLFDRRIGKVVARAPQFFAVRALLERLGQRGLDGARQGGVVWHAAGAGKSLTMVFLSKALLLQASLAQCRLVVVTDRIDLEHQLGRNFMSGGAFGSAIASQRDGERSKALSGRDLAQRIGHGTDRITFALVHKFLSASRLPACHNDSPDVVVLVDEAHRGHGGEMHERMKKALPRAAYVAFTGTPLLKDEKTAAKFGPIVHAYPLQRAVADHAVVPLLYEVRMPALEVNAEAADRWFERATAGLGDDRRVELKRRFASRSALFGAAARIELIAWDIATHFSERIRAVAPGLKGQLATASKRDALHYKNALDATGLVSSVVVISPPDMREGSEAPDAASAVQMRQWWQRTVLAHGGDALQYERQALQAFGSEGGPDLLIVVDRLLTGFDEPRNAVLYIDKPLQGHTLIQAVARVNRLHDAKRHGLLVDYRGVLKALDTAMQDYRELASRTGQGGFDTADLAGLYRRVDVEHARLPAVGDASSGRASAPTPFDEPVFGGQVRESDLRYVVHRLGQRDEAQDSWSAERTRHEAHLVRARIEATIALDLAGDPDGQKRFSDMLKDTIAKAETEARFEPPGRQYARLREFEHRLQARDHSRVPELLAHNPQAAACYGAILTVRGDADAAALDDAARRMHADHALAIAHLMRHALAEHSLSSQAADAAIRKGLLTQFHALLGLAKTGELITQVLRIARRESGTGA